MLTTWPGGSGGRSAGGCSGAAAGRGFASAAGRGVSTCCAAAFAAIDSARTHTAAVALDMSLLIPALFAGPMAQSRARSVEAIGAIAISVVMIGAGVIGASSMGLMWLRGSTSPAGTVPGASSATVATSAPREICCVGLPALRRAADCIGGRVTAGAVRSAAPWFDRRLRRHGGRNGSRTLLDGWFLRLAHQSDADHHHDNCGSCDQWLPPERGVRLRLAQSLDHAGPERRIRIDVHQVPDGVVDRLVDLPFTHTRTPLMRASFSAVAALPRLAT